MNKSYHAFEFLDPVDLLLPAFRGGGAVSGTFSVQLPLLLLVHHHPEQGHIQNEGMVKNEKQSCDQAVGRHLPRRLNTITLATSFLHLADVI